MVLKQREGACGGINVTPLIDVLLVLLIIFMVITPGQPVGLAATVPQPPSDRPNSGGPDSTVVVQIDRNRQVTINSEVTDLDKLGDRLREIFKARATRVVFVKADRDLEFREVAKTIDIARGAGIDAVGLL